MEFKVCVLPTCAPFNVQEYEPTGTAVVVKLKLPPSQIGPLLDAVVVHAHCGLLADNTVTVPLATPVDEPPFTPGPVAVQVYVVVLLGEIVMDDVV
jgi:hypothetical protein